MAHTLRRWLKKWLGLDVIEAENLRLARAILAMERRIDEFADNTVASVDDFEARIAFLESHLTPKASSPKIVAKAKPVTFRQFAAAASLASEEVENDA